MKKLLAIISISLITLPVLADEGFWLAFLLGDQTYSDMMKKGLKLSRDQLFSLNKNSIKDGILCINGEASASMISGEGLLLTNYQLGLRTLLSTDDQPRIINGFFAGKRKDEIPAKNYYADYLLKIEDVSLEMEEAIKGSTGLDRAAKIFATKNQIAKKYSDERNSIQASVKAILKGNQWLVFVCQRFQDLRLAVVPPRALATFGQGSDDWEWPSYRDDFCIMRIYAAADGKPAVYNADNIPYKPKYFFPVSVKGYKETDFTLVYGFPGKTDRYETSMGLKLHMETTAPAAIKLYGIERDFLLEEMKKDPSVKTQLGAREEFFARSAAFQEGELKRLSRSNLYATRRTAEESFQQWAGGKPAYETLFKDWIRMYSVWGPYAKHRIYLNVGILGSSLMSFTAGMQRVENALVKTNGGDLRKILAEVNASRQQFLREENKSSDRKMVAAMTRLFFTDIDKNQHPIGFYEGLKGSFGDLKDEGSYVKYATAIFSTTMIFDDAKWNAFMANPDASVLQEDPAYKYVNSFLQNWQGKYAVYYRQFLATDEELGKGYLRGMMEMDPKKTRYTDADSTLRFSYGNVKSYSPGASTKFEATSTMSGFFEKQNARDAAQEIPVVFLDKAKKKDFGPWADKQKNEMILAFTTNNDITHGNPGSPVLNAAGELIGMVIYVNKESLASRYLYDPADSRAVCQDIRYIMWTIETGGSGNLSAEIKQVR